MSDVHHGVGLNGETDDFSARYDRMVVGNGRVWALKTLLTMIGLLVVVALAGRLLGR